MSAPRKTSPRRSARAAGPAAIVAAAEVADAPRPDALGPLRSVVRFWWVVLIVTVLAVAGAVAAGLAQAPTYTASSDINVGRVDVRVQTLPGYVAGAQALAAAYARVATSDELIDPLAKRLKLPAAQLRARISSSPVPNATIFRIWGTGASEQDAISVTRAATQQMETIVTAQDGSRTELSDVLSEYRDVSRQAATLRAGIDRLKNPPTSPAATATPTSRKARDRRDAQVASLQVALDTAELKMQTLGGRYQERGNELAATAGIQVISRPETAASDRHRTVQRLATIGLLGGLVLGAALAALLDRRRRA